MVLGIVLLTLIWCSGTGSFLVEEITLRTVNAFSIQKLVAIGVCKFILPLLTCKLFI